jgi:hypothetical protein
MPAIAAHPPPGMVSSEMAMGQCLCGAVRYRVDGPLGDVILCHCIDCRRWHGHVSATSAAARDEMVLVEARGLRWIDSPDSETKARRAFCAECGSSLFWDAPGNDTISIAAGTLDAPTGLRVTSHWFASQAGDYYELPDDDLPHHSRSGDGEVY